ncbi:MAG: hypothetical protein RL632_943 [Bacteroidota bacterium]|jgi:hypothetical protein
MKILTTAIALLLFYHSYSQWCITNVGPTTTADSNVQSVVLVGASGSINFVGCPGVIGVQDLTALSTSLNAGSTYTISIQFGTCGGNYTGKGQAWIDYNGDGIFDPAESLGTWEGIPPTPLSTFTFTVPAGSQNGTTRMRVTQQEGASSLPLSPCASFSWGSVMDFSINISNGIDCSGYPGDFTNDAIAVTSLPYTSSGDNSICYSNQNLVYNSPDLYYQLNPSPLMQSIHVSLCGSTFDTFLTVVDPQGNVLAFNDDSDNCGTSSELTFDPQGQGLVYVIVEGWGNEVGAFDIAIDANYLGMNENDADHVLIYPNPATETITIQGIQGNVEFTSITGATVKRIPSYSGEKISLMGFTEGVYFVHFEKNGISYSEKIIIRK